MHGCIVNIAVDFCERRAALALWHGSLHGCVNTIQEYIALCRDRTGEDAPSEAVDEGQFKASSQNVADARRLSSAAAAPRCVFCGVSQRRQSSRGTDERVGYRVSGRVAAIREVV